VRKGGLNVLLGVTTTTSALGVALGEAGAGAAAELTLPAGRRHAELLSPAVDYLCRVTGTSLAELGSVAVDCGPGLFTGLRVGLAAAKAWASALGIPVLGASSLEVLAWPMLQVASTVVAVVDARRGEVFWRRFQSTAGGSLEASDAQVGAPEKLASELEELEAVLVGDGASRYRSVLMGRGGRLTLAGPAFDHPRASVLVGMAAHLTPQDPDQVAPIYLREPDVRIGWQSRGH